MIGSWQESYEKPRQCVEKQRHYSADKGTYSQGYGLPSDHIWLWELDHKEGRAPKNWCLQTVVLQKTPESPLDSKEIKPANMKRNQLWIHIGRADAEAEAPVFWPPDVNSRLLGKVPDAWKYWGQKEKRVSEDEMAGWYHRCNGHELGKISGDGEGQGDLVCCSPRGHKELNVTGQLNNNNFWITLVDQENVDFHVYWHYFWGQLSKEEIKKKRKQIDGQVDKGNWQKINISLEQFSMEREFSGIENGSSQEDLWLMKSNCHRTFGGKKDTHIICTKARKCMGNELI